MIFRFFRKTVELCIFLCYYLVGKGKVSLRLHCPPSLFSSAVVDIFAVLGGDAAAEHEYLGKTGKERSFLWL